MTARSRSTWGNFTGKVRTSQADTAPVTDDTQRQSATYGDKESRAERHLTTVPNIIRHAELGLQNRRLQVRFLSHLPLSAEFMRVALLWPQHNVRALIPIGPKLHTTKYITADL